MTHLDVYFMCAYYRLNSQTRGASGTVYTCSGIIQTIADAEKEKSILYNMEKEKERERDTE